MVKAALSLWSAQWTRPRAVVSFETSVGCLTRFRVVVSEEDETDENGNEDEEKEEEDDQEEDEDELIEADPIPGIVLAKIVEIDIAELGTKQVVFIVNYDFNMILIDRNRPKMGISVDFRCQ